MTTSSATKRIPISSHRASFGSAHARFDTALSIDREQLLQTALLGNGRLGNDHPIPVTDRFYNSELPQRAYDPERAKFYLKEAGLDGLSVTLSASDAAFTGARVVLRHAAPNAAAPIINVVAFNIAYLITGVVLVEAVFNYNGLGRFMVDAVSKRDLPMVQAAAMVFAAAYVILNMTADIAAIALNPRLRYPRAREA